MKNSLAFISKHITVAQASTANEIQNFDFSIPQDYKGGVIGMRVVTYTDGGLGSKWQIGIDTPNEGAVIPLSGHDKFLFDESNPEKFFRHFTHFGGGQDVTIQVKPLAALAATDLYFTVELLVSRVALNNGETC